MIKVTQSIHQMPCVEITDRKLAPKLRAAIADNYMHSDAYKARQGSGAFLQCYDERTGYVLIEFWTPNYQYFVNYLNDLIEKKEE